MVAGEKLDHKIRVIRGNVRGFTFYESKDTCISPKKKSSKRDIEAPCGLLLKATVAWLLS